MFLLHSRHYILSLSHSSPQSQSLTSIKCSGCHQWSSSHHGNPGNPGPQSSGSPQWDVPLFLCLCSPSPPVSSVSIWSCSLSHFLGRDGNFTLFLHTSLPRVVLYTHPSISRSFVSFMCHAVCLSLSVKRQSCSRVVESWQSRLSCGVPSCQTYQSCAPAYLPVSDDDKSAQLV